MPEWISDLGRACLEFFSTGLPNFFAKIAENPAYVGVIVVVSLWVLAVPFLLAFVRRKNKKLAAAEYEAARPEETTSQEAHTDQERDEAPELEALSPTAEDEL